MRFSFPIVNMAAFALLSISNATVNGQTTESPQQLVQKTVDHELSAAQNGPRFLAADRKEAGHGSQTKLLIDTNQGPVGLLVAVDDKPLTQEQRQAEDHRLDALVHNPDELRKKEKSAKEDADRVCRIMKALPNAFLYEPAGTEPGTQEVGKPGDELIRLKFRPNPNYQPPSRIEQVLMGMQGTIAIDPKQHRIARIDGTLIEEVSFGWGILGHLDSGGHYLVEQADVGGGNWDVTRMNLSFTGKLLILKSLNIKSSEVITDVHPVPPNLSFAQGVDLLKTRAAQLPATTAAKTP